MQLCRMVFAAGHISIGLMGTDMIDGFSPRDEPILRTTFCLMLL